MFFVTHIFFKQLKRCHIIRPFHFYTCNKEFSLEHWKCFPAFKSSHRRYSVRIGLLRNFAKFTGKHLYQSLRPATLLKMRVWHRCFPVNFAKFLRKPFYRTTPRDCIYALFILIQSSLSFSILERVFWFTVTKNKTFLKYFL